MKSSQSDLRLMNTVTCRTPVFSFDQEIKQSLPFLKDIIREASPQFFGVIENLDYEQISAGNEKIAFSLWKYFNRARYRATPFGNFAAISLLPVSFDKAAPPVIINKKLNSGYYTDWAEKDLHLQNLKKITQSSAFFLANATWYLVGNEVRYIKRTDGEFELAAVNNFPELNSLLTAGKNKIKRDDIYTLMASEFQVEKKVVDDMLYQLVSCQLLLTENHPNITGEDYFKRLNLAQRSTSTNYIIAERWVKSGSFDSTALSCLPEYFNFIKDFTPAAKNDNLSTFAQKFSKKFDLKAVPLSIAIDPETGVGYGDMEQVPLGPELSSILGNLTDKQTLDKQFSYTAQYRFLLNGLIKGDTIQLEKFETADNTVAAQLPNTFNVLFNYWNDSIVLLESTGGCTANALLGRFTIGNRQAKAFGKEITNIEETANPDVLFFDIAYQAEQRVDNVNRRKQLYQYELPILSWSCSEAPLSLDDIWVIVRNGEVILWSKQYRKRMAPRLATAYNYTRSDLAVYRFLCDLQHQNLKTDLTFHIQQFFPGLDHYPRVVYKNIIVSPEMWRLKPKSTFGTGKTISQTLLNDWLQSQHINSQFKCGNGDQTLCFNPADGKDMDMFRIFCTHNAELEIYIKEALIDEAGMIADEEGNKYIPQYVAAFFHEGPVYKSIDLSNIIGLATQHVNEKFFPGSEWLYFEIYCHPLRSNQVLVECINELISPYKHLLQKWFFIRYNYPDYHIRLRLQLFDVSVANMVMAQLRTLLEPLCINGLVSDIQIKTYHRETERYGRERIKLVEDFFCQDSLYVLQLLSKSRTAYQLYPITLQWMNELFELTIENIAERLDVTKVIADNFSREFSIGTEDYKAVNRSFESLKTEMGTYVFPVKQRFLKQYYETFAKVINSCTTIAEKTNILADLVHMHINRVFYTNQRMHEAILYQYLLKLLRTKKYHPIAGPAPVSAL
jgi:thiopeptide-type bacteriocin biosynthesis protein